MLTVRRELIREELIPGIVVLAQDVLIFRRCLLRFPELVLPQPMLGLDLFEAIIEMPEHRLSKVRGNRVDLPSDEIEPSVLGQHARIANRLINGEALLLAGI